MKNDISQPPPFKHLTDNYNVPVHLLIDLCDIATELHWTFLCIGSWSNVLIIHDLYVGEGWKDKFVWAAPFWGMG